MFAYTEEVMREYRAFLDETLAFEPARDVPLGKGSVGEVADEIGRRVDEGRGFFFARLGDGEGACLFGLDPREALRTPVLARTLALHFGRRRWTLDDFAYWHRSVADAAAQADIVAAATVEMMRATAERAPPDVRGTVGAIAGGMHAQSAPLAPGARLYATWHIHSHLMPHYPAILRGREVALVTCYGDDFPDRVARAFDCTVVGTVLIPGQAVNERDGVPDPLYPGHMDRVRAELEALAAPGRVGLIAAGLAGKELCARAAARGMVALDVGSMMDVWYGRGVRPYQTDEFVAAGRLP